MKLLYPFELNHEQWGKLRIFSEWSSDLDSAVSKLSWIYYYLSTHRSLNNRHMRFYKQEELINNISTASCSAYSENYFDNGFIHSMDG